MRNQESWEDKVLPNVLKEKFTPRLQDDLKKIKPPELPALGSYFIYGPVKSGKTVMAAFMMIEAQRQKFLNVTSDVILFVNATVLLNEIKACYDDPTKSEQDILKKYSDADFLVFDDLGAEKPTEWTMSTFYLIINNRYEYLKTTVFTSNHSLDELGDKFGDDRIPSRIERMCTLMKRTKFK